MDLALPLALSAEAATGGLVFIFVIPFPLVVTVLLLFTTAQIAREHQQNLDDLDGVEDRA